MTKHRRTKYLVKTGLQLRYMGIIVFAMLVIAFFVGWVTYYITWNTIANTPDFTLYGLPAVFETVNQSLIKWVIVFVVMIAGFSIFISHRIAGPVYRLEQTTKLIASGDLTHRVHLRSGDELMDLQDAFNTMTDSLAAMINKDREVISRLIATSDNLKKKISDKELKRSELEEIKNELESITDELQQISSTFKLNDTQEENQTKEVREKYIPIKDNSENLEKKKKKSKKHKKKKK